MKLTYFENNLPDRYWSETISGVEIGLIYYVWEGRNAYWATWNERWYSDSFYTKLNEAKNCAESLRKQGSVFKIVERPVLVFEAKSVRVYLTQSRTQHPFKHYKVPASLDEFIKKQKSLIQKRWIDKKIYDVLTRHWENIYENSPKKGRNLLEVYLSFHQNSIYMDAYPQLLTLYDESLEPLEILDTNSYEAKDWVSSARGGSSYFLKWHKVPKEINLSSLVKIFNDSVKSE